MNSKIISIAVVTAIVFAGAGFYGGTKYEKNSLSKQGLLRNTAQSQNQNRQFGQGTNQSGSGQSRAFVRNGNGGGFTTGQITAKDDKSITIKTQDGSSKIVFFSDSTTVGKAVQGSVSDLNVGDQVVANGQNNSDGSLAAQNIQIRPDQQNQ